MDNMKLFVIGNGFDLEHKIKTNYMDFRNWINEKYPVVANHFSEELSYVSTDDEEKLWSEFEETLSLFDSYYFGEKADDLYLGEENLYTNAYIEEISNASYSVIDMKKYFKEWIESVCIDTSYRRGDITNKDLFITFNYTLTLEKIYGIDDNFIYHIHGSVLNDIVLGHNKDYSNDFDNLKLDRDGGGDLFDGGEVDFRIELAREEIKSLTKKYCKPTEKLIDELQDWFKSKPVVDEIIVLGHSYGKVDWKYFNFLKKTFPKAPWTCYCFDDATSNRLGQFLIEYGPLD